MLIISPFLTKDNPTFLTAATSETSQSLQSCQNIINPRGTRFSYRRDLFGSSSFRLIYNLYRVSPMTTILNHPHFSRLFLLLYEIVSSSFVLLLLPLHYPRIIRI
jgi:hypothetical protein